MIRSQVVEAFRAVGRPARMGNLFLKTTDQPITDESIAAWLAIHE